MGVKGREIFLSKNLLGSVRPKGITGLSYSIRMETPYPLKTPLVSGLPAGC